MSYIFLIVGFLLLFFGADFFVSSTSNISKSFNINPFFMGLTIVAFGTSSPELSVSILSALNGSSNLCMGNILGSNLFNILMVVGALGFIKTLHVENSILKREFPFLILCSIVLAILSADGLLGRMDGILLLLLFIYYISSFSPMDNYKDSLPLIYRNFIQFKKNTKFHDIIICILSLLTIFIGGKMVVESCISIVESLPLIYRNFIQFKKNTKFHDIIICILSLLTIFIGGKMVVESCISIVESFRISDKLIGFTIVAIGTSLPELITSLIAASKGEADIALGSIIGSNIFNTLFVIAIPVLITPLSIGSDFILDIIFTLILYFKFINYIYRRKNGC